jgi:pimeloyl-ACP methyl ester carboxylesterase
MNACANVTVDGVSIAVDRVGQGRPVVCLSAIGHDARDFDALAARLGGRFEFIRLEWPGHGRSGADQQPACARRYADLAAQVLDVLGIAQPILIGNSIGGAAAILLAAERGVAGVVLCDCGGLVEVGPTAQRFCGAFAAFFAAGERRAAWYGPAFAVYYRFVLPSPAARAQRRRIVAGAYATAKPTRQAWESFGRPEADIRAVAARLAVPVWVAWARGDVVIPLARCRAAIAAIPGARLTVFAGGHAAFLEQPDAFAAGFLDFATGLTAGLATPAQAA